VRVISGTRGCAGWKWVPGGPARPLSGRSAELRPRLLLKSLNQPSAGIWSGATGHGRKVRRLSCAITLLASLRWICSWCAPSRSSCSTAW
jgi:hypothetical protein